MSQTENETIKEEMLEAWDWETGRPTGRSVPRGKSHREGIPHEGVHLWIIRTQPRGPELLFQHRAPDKDSYPDLLDITVGGHVPFGLRENKVQKEAWEEVGIIPQREFLLDLGYVRYEERTATRFHREFQHVYLLHDDRDLSAYRFSDGEVVGIYAVALGDLALLLERDHSFEAEGWDGSRALRRTVSRRDFHPELFAESMRRYMNFLIRACREFAADGRVSDRLEL